MLMMKHDAATRKKIEGLTPPHYLQRSKDRTRPNPFVAVDAVAQAIRPVLRSEISVCRPNAEKDA
jgi:hypothetical protein